MIICLLTTNIYIFSFFFIFAMEQGTAILPLLAGIYVDTFFRIYVLQKHIHFQFFCLVTMIIWNNMLGFTLCHETGPCCAAQAGILCVAQPALAFCVLGLQVCAIVVSHVFLGFHLLSCQTDCISFYLITL